MYIPSSPKEAIEIQLDLREKCVYRREIELADVRYVAGADAAYSHYRIHAAVVVMTFPDLAVQECGTAVEPVKFPYIPGLLAFREGPALCSAWENLTMKPDVAMFNGHGYAHPRRFGIASHIGVLLDIPTIGVADRPLATSKAPRMQNARRGYSMPYTDDDTIIGSALCTRDGARPAYVSAGHKTDLAFALEFVLRTTRSHRFPEPLVEAHRIATRNRNAHDISPEKSGGS
jgi:deoxyribonuclease V